MKRIGIIICSFALCLSGSFAPVAYADDDSEVAAPAIETAKLGSSPISDIEPAIIVSPPVEVVVPTVNPLAPILTAPIPVVPEQPASPVQTTILPSATPKPVQYALVRASYGELPIYISAIDASDPAGVSIEVYNNSETAYNMSHTSIRVMYASDVDEQECQLQPQKGYLLAGRYLSYRGFGEEGYVSDCLRAVGGNFGLFRIELMNSDTIVEQVTFELAGRNQRYLWKSRPSDGTKIMNDSASVSQPTDILLHRGEEGTFYEPYGTLPLRIVEVLPRPKTCAQNDTSLRCDAYVKIINTSDQPIVLDGLHLRSGNRNSAASSSNTTLLQGMVAAHEFTIISSKHHSATGELTLNSSAGAVWFEDHYIAGVQYESDVLYEDAQLVANEGRSWAYDDQNKIWKWTSPAPETAANIFDIEVEVPEQLIEAKDTRVPCREDQYRSEETGRCRSVRTENESSKKPCAPGQYRNESTGRCRSLVSEVSTSLKPCADNQFRNPLTGRCKSIASVEDLEGLKPCPAGQERNPTTHRCRKIKTAAMPLAQYAALPVKEVGTSFVGWWAAGGLAAVALGYGLWEWREEIGRAVRRVWVAASGRRP